MSVFRQGNALRRAICAAGTRRSVVQRGFHASSRLDVLKPFLLADIGEGIREVQIIQWFVKPGARVEQFDKICEVQSDKASVEITSRFDGVIRKLHYEADDMAVVGKPLVDIDIQSEISAEDEALTMPSPEDSSQEASTEQSGQTSPKDEAEADKSDQSTSSRPEPVPNETKRGKHATLSTPAVRHLTKELGIKIEDVEGTGREGRVTKEDVYKHKASLSASPEPAPPTTVSTEPDRTIPLNPVQAQMFKTMTRSLSIPHFLYSDSVDMGNLLKLRHSLNQDRAPSQAKISSLAFILKAVSLALQQYPLINARLDLSTNPEKPHLHMRGAHNLGIAVDTPQGLLVPVIKSVQSLSISSIASEIARLASLGREGKLGTSDLTGGTLTVSNIGSIGGGVVAPVLVDSQVAILGVGKTRTVPAFDEQGIVVRREECVFSWSADHRVVDGATLARCAEVVRRYLEEPEHMFVQLR